MQAVSLELSIQTKNIQFMLKNKSEKFFIISVILATFSVLSLFTISNFLINSKIDCSSKICGQIFKDDDVIQYVDFSFNNKYYKKKYQNAQANSIRIKKIGNTIIVDIPQLKPELSSLRAELVNVRDDATIRVIISESRSIYIFVDSKIAYTHRYELPVFQINPERLVTFEGIDAETYIVSTNQLAKNPEPLETGRIVLVLFLITLLTLLISQIFKVQTSDYVHPEVYKRPYIFGVIFFWIASVMFYFLKPFDPVGAQNPGLFGPLGAAFSDYFQIAQISQFNKPYDLGGVNYPPASLFFGKLVFYVLPGLPGFILFIGVSLGLILTLIRKSGVMQSPRKALIFISFYPLIFGLVRGNLDILAVCLVFYSVSLLDKFNGRVSTVLLAFAISIKIWPIVFILYLGKWKDRKLLYETLIYVVIITLGSGYALGYNNFDEILKVISTSFNAADNITTQAFRYCFSLSSLVFFSHLFVTTDSPWNPIKSEIESSIIFADSIFAKAIILFSLLLLLIALIRSNSKKQSFLFMSGIVLLLPTPSYTYRGAILLGYFILFNKENESKRFKNRSIDRFLRRVQLSMWIPIFAPSTFYFANNSEISTASLIQPLSLMTILGVELYFLFSQGGYFQSRRPFSRIRS